MYTFIIALVSMLALAAAQVTGQLGNAKAIYNNPIGASYMAYFTPSLTSGVTGSVVAFSGVGGKGVDFAVQINGLPAEGGPFPYHIHAAPVPADGNCTGTLSHLDPYIRGEDPPCDPSKPATCQVGDLSGKHGTINGSSATISYNDMYASLKPGIGAFFGNRSVVVHFANKTRIACANFTLISGGYENGTSPFPTGSGSPSSAIAYPTHTPLAPSAALFTGAAQAVQAGASVAGASFFGALMAFLL